MNPRKTARHNHLLVPFLALSCTMVLFWGCAGLGTKLEPPRINLAHIAVQEIKTFETVFKLQLRVFNTNDIPLVIKALDSDLDVNGKRLATGVTETETTIPALGSGLLDVAVYASSLQMVARVLDGLGDSGTGRKQESIDYTLSGRLHLGGRALPSRIPFTTAGTLSMDRFSR